MVCAVVTGATLANARSKGANRHPTPSDAVITSMPRMYGRSASGTSMASPHIAGVVALMQEAAGGTLRPDQVLNALTSTAKPLPGYGTWEVGAGFVDAYAAVMAVKK